MIACGRLFYDKSSRGENKPDFLLDTQLVAAAEFDFFRGSTIVRLLDLSPSFSLPLHPIVPGPSLFPTTHQMLDHIAYPKSKCVLPRAVSHGGYI